MKKVLFAATAILAVLAAIGKIAEKRESEEN